MVDDVGQLRDRQRLARRLERGHVGRDAAATVLAVALGAGELDEDMPAGSDVRVDRPGGRLSGADGDGAPRLALCRVSDRPANDAGDECEPERDQDDQRLRSGCGNVALACHLPLGRGCRSRHLRRLSQPVKLQLLGVGAPPQERTKPSCFLSHRNAPVPLASVAATTTYCGVSRKRLQARFQHSGLRAKEAQITVTIRFPDRTVERLTLLEEPEVGAAIEARDGRWRITRMRLPWGLDVHGDVVYDLDVEPAPNEVPTVMNVSVLVSTFLAATTR